MSYQIFIGDCIDSMRKMPDQSVHSCITSPPYYGLRDYGVEGQIGLEESVSCFKSFTIGPSSACQSCN